MPVCIYMDILCSCVSVCIWWTMNGGRDSIIIGTSVISIVVGKSMYVYIIVAVFFL